MKRLRPPISDPKSTHVVVGTHRGRRRSWGGPRQFGGWSHQSATLTPIMCHQRPSRVRSTKEVGYGPQLEVSTNSEAGEANRHPRPHPLGRRHWREWGRGRRFAALTFLHSVELK
ncbi:hypothetical protein CRG98_014116 [Punica granatum]|uniref:Uncharacterized protein n=1 Tax=Punica granatum TaxID=22663 RepID=A0A2I0KCM0_PUNGR|nr:hypothetical protein CRG98_014116 [Punica granatum]